MKTNLACETQIPGLKRLWKDSFGDTDAFIDRFFVTAFAPNRCCCIADNEDILAAAYWFDVEFSGKKAAYIYAVATATQHRGKGLCRQLMNWIHNHLANQGYAGTMLVPGDDGLREMYAKMDYVNFGGMTEFACAAEGSAATYREISVQTFAALRRQMLPPGGVIQESENLAFLRQFYRFYQGENWLLAAASTGCELFAAELLGDPTVAPAILAAFGVPSGVFRTPGPESFAMYRSLDDTPAPGYFAFAFD